MIASITCHTIANTIKMMRGNYHGSILIIEGNDDRRLYSTLISPSDCRVMYAGNKENALGAIDLLDKDSYSGILVIVDSDFDILEARQYPSKNVVHTDTHDLETMMLQSKSLEKIIIEFGSSEKLDKFTGDIRTTIIQSGIYIGYLRWLSLQKEINLRFNGLKFSRFMDIPTLSLNIDKLIKTISNHSMMPNLSGEEIKKDIEKLRDDVHDPWQLCCGHDLIEILCLGLRSIFGSQNSKDVTCATLGRSLRIGYQYSYFISTQLYESIKEWENLNKPFKIL